MDIVGGDPTKVFIDNSSTGIDIKFNNIQFSIRCGKCADIHNAQLEGKTNRPCNCDCHESHYNPWVNPIDPCCPQIPYYPTYYTTSPNTTSGSCIDKNHYSGNQDDL